MQVLKYREKIFKKNAKEPLFKGKKKFIELKDRELKDGEVKIEREIEELFFKRIIVFIDAMEKFEQKEMNKIRLIKNTWYDWLIRYIPEPIRKRVGGFKEKITSLLRQAHPNKPCMGGEGNAANQKHKTLEILLYQKIKRKKLKM